MNKLLGIFFVFGSFLCLAQSKQEQIDMLNQRIDSLKRVNFEQALVLKKSTYDQEEYQKKTSLELQNQLNTIQVLELKLSQMAYLSNLDAAAQVRLYHQTDSLTKLIVELKNKGGKPLQPAKIDTSTQLKVIETAPANFYISIRIGTQQWMTQNLNVFTFSNGDTLQQAFSIDQWNAGYLNKQPMWCYPNFDSTSTNKSSKLYNWYAINDTRGLAPNGWHISTSEDWQLLKQFAGPTLGTTIKSTMGWADFEQLVLCTHTLSGYSISTCNQCKGTGFMTSESNSGNGTNQLGFNATPLPYFSENSFQGEADRIGYWIKNEEAEKAILLKHFSSELYDHQLPLKAQGFAVRCLKN